MKTMPSHSNKYFYTIEIHRDNAPIGTVDRIVTPGRSHRCSINGKDMEVEEPWGNAHVRIWGDRKNPRDLDTRGYK
jgi:hypothetical protein